MISLLFGENNYESWREFKSLEKRILDENKDIEHLTFDHDELIEKHVDFSSFDFFNKKKFYSIKRFFNLTKTEREKLFNELLNSQHEIVLWEDGKVDKRLKELKILKEKGNVIEFKILVWDKLRRWVEGYFKELKLIPNSKVVEKLIFRFASNQWLISSEIDKIALYKKQNEDKVIREEDMQLISHTDNINSFYFSDLFFSKQKSTALKYLDQMILEVGDEFMLMGNLASQLRCIYLLKTLPLGSEGELTSKLGINPYTIRNCKRFVDNFSIERLKKLYDQLSNLDYSLKIGDLDAKIGLSLLIASL